MSRARVLVTLVVIATLGLVVAGCSSAEPAAEQPAETAPAAPAAGNELSGTSWECVTFTVGGRTFTESADAPITAEFGEDGTLSGKSGVNSYNTSYEVDGPNITIGPEIATTKMAGPEEAMVRETDYLTTLPTAQSYQIDANTGELVLFGPAQNNIARYRPAE